MAKKPVMLMVLDGWGINDNLNEVNAIREVHPKNFERLSNEYSNTRINAAGEYVGLPDGQMGNSEVGHLNLGAGRVIYQPLVKISKEIRTGEILENPVLKETMEKAKENGKAVHFTGLLSDGGVHSHIDHLIGLVDMAKKIGVPKVFIHAITDGRDTAPKSALGFLEKLENALTEIGLGKVATVSGRYTAMDRDSNWDRTEKAFRAIAFGEGDKQLSAKKAIEISYEEDVVDEFIKPTVISDAAGNAIGKINEGDAFIFFNFRPDRARQLARVFLDPEFDGFARGQYPKVDFVCMRQYDSKLKAKIAYVDDDVNKTFGEVVSKAGLTQLRTAETEKYAHVTFFFNGGVEAQFEGEDRILVPSPKVATYDLQPEMSAYELTDKVLEALSKDLYDVVIMNYANPDMVGHTGVVEAAKKAVAVVDECLGKIADKILEKNGSLLVTADHGNVDLMVDPVTGVPFTQHTTNQVPLLLVSNEYKGVELKENGKLADLAPTMLDILGIEKPVEMDGESLIKK
ncbi:MAG: 2,3-bisphosphoglycerate-independent phosphoglycerate mutase [Fusobacteriaceae bacterium]|nr:2,3-bisphosphoglycerate-independent phosphoglycerate mutase [Fusobacteriaceae bacterium]MBN2837554.1 2,3-bisphosphoglycerate-independent phosphoglycerate mutase [Fusobacteriaceae bacterium]